MKTTLDDAIKALKDCPTVNIKGKQYSTVATRLEVFRRYFGCEWALVTEMLQASEPMVRIRAEIHDPERRVIATGMAEENRTLGINKTSAVENCETSAIGRALANLGLHGGEFATAEEVDHAIKGQGEIEETASNKAKTKLQSDMRAFDRDLQRVSDSEELAGLLESYKTTLEAARSRVDMRGWWDGTKDVPGAKQRVEAKRRDLDAIESGQPPAWESWVSAAEELLSKSKDLNAVKAFWKQNGSHIAALPAEAIDRLTKAKDAAKSRLDPSRPVAGKTGGQGSPSKTDEAPKPSSAESPPDDGPVLMP